MKKGLQLSVDGLEPNSIREILGTEIVSIQERHKLGSEIFTTLGTFAPALGMIGTLIGLVQMLKTMDDPSSIGPSMAVALSHHLLWAILANLFCLPVAGKLKTRSNQEVHDEGTDDRGDHRHRQGGQPENHRAETECLPARWS